MRIVTQRSTFYYTVFYNCSYMYVAEKKARLYYIYTMYNLLVQYACVCVTSQGVLSIRTRGGDHLLALFAFLPCMSICVCGSQMHRFQKMRVSRNCIQLIRCEECQLIITQLASCYQLPNTRLILQDNNMFVALVSLFCCMCTVCIYAWPSCAGFNPQSILYRIMFLELIANLKKNIIHNFQRSPTAMATYPAQV